MLRKGTKGKERQFKKRKTKKEREEVQWKRDREKGRQKRAILR